MTNLLIQPLIHQTQNQTIQPKLYQKTISQRPTRTIRPPSRYDDYICGNITTNPKTLYHIQSVAGYEKLMPSYKKLALSICSIIEPITYNQVSKEECWRQAMKTKLNALEDNQT